MSRDNYKIKDTLKLRENMNIDRGKDKQVVWAIIVICVVTFSYLVVFDSRFDDVRQEVKR